MKKMQRAAALAVCLCLLCSCTPFGLWKYPKPQSDVLQGGESELITIVLPPDADQTIIDAMDLIGAKAKEISGGKLIVKSAAAPDFFELYQNGEADAALFWDTDAAALDAGFGYTTAPFLFQDTNKMLTHFSSVGILKELSVEKKLKGSVLAIYYGGTMGIALRSNQYLPQVGVEGISSIGVCEELAANGLFEKMGAPKTVVAGAKELEAQLNEQKLRAMEVPLHGKLPDGAKYLEVTRHRMRIFWLLLSNSTQLSENGINYLQEAVAYTIESQNSSRLSREEEWLAMLESQGVTVTRGDYSAMLYEPAAKLYKNSFEELGISRKVWQLLRPLIS